MYQQSSQSGFSSIPTVIKNLLIINVLVLIAQESGGPLGPILEKWFALWPIGPGPERIAYPDGSIREIASFWPWQLITYSFLHGDFWHLLMNMFGLWMLGSSLEHVWGGKRFALYYFVCVIGGGVLQLAATYGGYVMTLGASGGVLGIVMAFGLLFPNQELILIPIPIPIKAKWFAAGWVVISIFGSIGPGGGIAHMAHLGGMIFGYVLIQYWRGKLPIQPKEKMYY